MTAGTNNPSNRARASKADEAYRRIREHIADGTFAPGTRLVLDRLAREFDMSTLPVREAIRRLEAEGYLQYQPNLGAMVATFDAESYVQALETLAVIESAATAQASPSISTDDLAAARALNDQMAEALNRLDGQAYAVRHDEFHELITARCPNDHLARVVSRERARLQRVRATFALGAGGRREIEEHRQLLELIESGAAPDAVEQLSRAHVVAAATALSR
jgi:DNA-binding GntR family transcriptional regulator